MSDFKRPDYEQRKQDWRNGAVYYQVMVDRFAPSSDLEAKRSLYAAPRKLRDWSETPHKGIYLDQEQIWSHELDFWGGDLRSLEGKLDYIQGLGADVVYLNPIFECLSNHKYDTGDYHKVDPALGTRADLKTLADTLHARRMHLVLDGVFNHMGRRSPIFREAQKDPKSPWRELFVFRSDDPEDYRAWMDVANLPELNLESDFAKDYIYRKPDSVVQSYLVQEGIDGWRLDVAYDIGYDILTELSVAAHAARPASVIIGEIYNYPEEWYPAVDGAMNMHSRAILFHMLKGKIAGPVASAMWDTMLADSSYEHLLKAWLVLDNHDTPRLADELPQPWQQRMAKVLQFTLPGSVCLYYGTELGMTGRDDPDNRAPMRWDLANDSNPHLVFERSLLHMRREEPALRWGDFRRLHSARLFAFLRRFTSARDTVIVIANPTAETVSEALQIRESKLQDVTTLRNQFGPETFTVYAGLVDVEIPPHEVLVLKPDVSPYPRGYNRYGRMR